MNRTIKEATVKRYHYDSHELIDHLQQFVLAYHSAQPLKTLKGLTPYEFISQQKTLYPEKFTIKHNH